MLKLANVSVNYGQFQALKDINLEVGQGELVVLLGANGAGKSTLFRTISGLSKPVNGEIYFGDEQIGGKAPHKLVHKGIVQCAEGRKLFPEMTVFENLKMGGYVFRSNKSLLKTELEGIYDLFPILKDKRNQPAGSLSGGQQQMLAIGRALMSKPKLLMLDEPSLGLAPLIVEQMFTIIEQINSSGTTVLLAEQNANAALQVSNRGYVIENGRIVLSGTRDELFNNDQVRKAYIGA
ncbi:ABC transporter ATP-binding protein [Bacillus luteolus]|uniref:ABC transporter ATP-binding protein n=1 Tax=Litchfieldia luteola TaxID=682179 RepID=A0ABR9QKC8_9BACI|nr:ABC transporter ATP-binding protein [Cytobacillus luteolus]MBE4908955.1 ABC transporter ATP-binding protein [Cytobacillus luteolus]MBP1941814.1 branched-chain amino acid transport system ATP-binding protein [Cytobacillus luteolus]